MAKQLFNKAIALPNDHGSWVFVISPLLIGLFAARRWEPAQIWMILAPTGLDDGQDPLRQA